MFLLTMTHQINNMLKHPANMTINKNYTNFYIDFINYFLVINMLYQNKIHLKKTTNWIENAYIQFDKWSQHCDLATD